MRDHITVKSHQKTIACIENNLNSIIEQKEADISARDATIEILKKQNADLCLAGEELVSANRAQKNQIDVLNKNEIKMQYKINTLEERIDNNRSAVKMALEYLHMTPADATRDELMRMIGQCEGRLSQITGSHAYSHIDHSKRKSMTGGAEQAYTDNCKRAY